MNANVEKAAETLETVVALSREGFDEIAATAGLLKFRVERGAEDRIDDRELHDILIAIRAKAQDMLNLVLAESERAGVYSTHQLERARQIAANSGQ